MPDAALPRANGLYATSQSVANIAGPLFGGTLVGLVGLPVTMLHQRAQLLVRHHRDAAGPHPLAAACRTASGQSAVPPAGLHDATYGYKWIWQHRAILYLLLIFTTCNFLIAPTYPLETLIVKNQLAAGGAALGWDGAFIFGLVSAAMAVGALASALFFSRGWAIKPMAWGVCIGWAVGGLAAHRLRPLHLGLALAGAGLLHGRVRAALQHPQPDDLDVLHARRRAGPHLRRPAHHRLGHPADLDCPGRPAGRADRGRAPCSSSSARSSALIALGNLVFNRTIRTLYAPDLEPAAAGRGLLYRR